MGYQILIAILGTTAAVIAIIFSLYFYIKKRGTAFQMNQLGSLFETFYLDPNCETLICTEKGKMEKFLQFHKARDDETEGITLCLPLADWNLAFIDRFVELQGAAFARYPVRHLPEVDHVTPRRIEIFFEKDFKGAQQFVQRAFRDVFGDLRHEVLVTWQ